MFIIFPSKNNTAIVMVSALRYININTYIRISYLTFKPLPCAAQRAKEICCYYELYFLLTLQNLHDHIPIQQVLLFTNGPISGL